MTVCKWKMTDKSVTAFKHLTRPHVHNCPG